MKKSLGRKFEWTNKITPVENKHLPTTINSIFIKKCLFIELLEEQLKSKNILTTY